MRDEKEVLSEKVTELKEGTKNINTGSEEATVPTEQSPPGCPICAFIEAGDCKLQHQVRLMLFDEIHAQLIQLPPTAELARCNYR
jgi:hypothetical protein